MNIEKIATVLGALGIVIAGGIWVGGIQTSVSNLSKQMEDLKNQETDQRCLLIVTRQADAIAKGKTKAVQPLSKLASENGCLKRLDSDRYVIATATRPATAAEIEARRKEQEAEERQFRKALSAIDDELGLPKDYE